MVKGFVGKGLEVDLTDGKLKDFRIEENVIKDYLGGYGLAVRLILEKQPLKADPLGKDNIIALAPGLIPGTDAPFSGRTSVAGKSPLTGAWGDANMGGFFGPELKKAGFDIVLVTGISKEPVYININNGKFELRSAKHFWGKDIVETEKIIKNELKDESTQIATIGQAGEKKSLISCVVTDGGRAAGRSGLGAVMGSKKLKAVAARGTETIEPVNKDQYEEVTAEINKMFDQSRLTRTSARLTQSLMPILVRLLGGRMASMAGGGGGGLMIEIFRKAGTGLGLPMSVASGDSPVKNWGGIGQRDFPISRANKISGSVAAGYQKERYACATCPLGCGGLLTVKDGEFSAENVHRPEYETLASFGPLVLNDNIEAIIKAADICNRYGMDVISAGTAISFAMECFENNLLSEELIDGLDLKWGNPNSMIKLLKMIGEREGIGDLLADGVRKASEKIGNKSEEYSIHIAGEEPGMHDPKSAPSFGTTYLVDPAPGRHTPGGAAFTEMMGTKLPLEGIEFPKVEKYQYTGKGRIQKDSMNFQHAINGLGICFFPAVGFIAEIPVLRLINAITGWNLNPQDILTIGERIHTARHIFNLTEGINPKEFNLPNRMKGNPPQEVGPNKGITIDIDSMVKDYYQAMDWDSNSLWPKSEKIENLGLQDIVKNRLDGKTN